MRIREWDAANYLTNEADRVAYLNAALEEGDPTLLQSALGDVARSIGMSKIAAQTGLGRESLYKSLRPESSPSFATIAKVAKAVGAQLTFTPSAAETKAA
jgi:probable addiction module antidote protein